MLDPLAKAILALATLHASPGRSPYSSQPLPNCGTDPNEPTCTIAPVCDAPAFYCRAPRWSAPRAAWVRVESRQAAVCRYARIAEAISSTARELNECKTRQNKPVPNCTPVGWKGSTKSLALSMLTVALHESGLREDVQNGIRPLGRGPKGEACLIQVRPNHGFRYASWLSDEDRERIESSFTEQERFAQTLLGESPEALARCFEVGGRMLARARRACEAGSVPWDYGMFSMYGSGATCRVKHIGESRKRTFRNLASRTKPLKKPIVRALEMCEHTREQAARRPENPQDKKR